MIVEIYWYIVTYPDGTQQHAVVDDSSDTVQFFYDNGTKDHPYFEAEAYHLSQWCLENDFGYAKGNQVITIGESK